MGGFLQAILFGYGGLRLRDDRLEIDPVLPPGCTQMNFTGVDYMGGSVDLTVTSTSMMLNLTSLHASVTSRFILNSPRGLEVLVIDKPVTLPLCKAYLQLVSRDYHRLVYHGLIDHPT